MVAEKEQQTVTSIEKFCIGVLAVVTGITVAAIICITALNLILYHRFTAPSTEDTDLAGGFVLLALAPVFLLVIIASITGVFYLFRKMK
ncbi:hypothetical protein RVV18_000797 [Burkholderia ambifaria]|jgi:hypothetical protein|uniref:hypothetical protein n=1 Tax=Burkholderia ambifaria TaxID=152480 RepID=UPI001592DE32|nr:hypothetical protein [Burkholderia ambifaria]ELK6205283.1 hypothetical protein [Burkholderia ambifaria]